eukprot:TRINITY_DN17971_c0_g1_i1.p1 TRINITY_DN17971_c0_g1~~TRINITY_DN17971_c0_g1_i1.p1  ORF type:complete len:300 (-),score=81.02 TRINITY_DN17971_c0_g1_i1:95-994(-)
MRQATSPVAALRRFLDEECCAASRAGDAACGPRTTYNVALASVLPRLDALQAAAKLVGTPPQFAAEMPLFERMLYKMRNQHRHALYFRHLQAARRDLRVLCELQFGERVAASAAAVFPSFAGVPQDRRPRRLVAPPVDALATQLRGLLALHTLVRAPISHIRRASLALFSELSHGFFMPLCLSLLAISSRLHTLALHSATICRALYNDAAAVCAAAGVVFNDNLPREIAVDPADTATPVPFPQPHAYPAPHAAAKELPPRSQSPAKPQSPTPRQQSRAPPQTQQPAKWRKTRGGRAAAV